MNKEYLEPNLELLYCLLASFLVIFHTRLFDNLFRLLIAGILCNFKVVLSVCLWRVGFVLLIALQVLQYRHVLQAVPYNIILNFKTIFDSGGRRRVMLKKERTHWNWITTSLSRTEALTWLENFIVNFIVNLFARSSATPSHLFLSLLSAQKPLRRPPDSNLVLNVIL